MITGTCMMVREAPATQGMKPSLVIPRIQAIAPRIPVMTIFLVRDDCIRLDLLSG
jgi:hypothetical protein